MKHKILLSLLVTSFIASANAQKIRAYAITASEKGQSGWAEVKLVDITTGEELKTIYRSADPVEPLNARTKKPIVKKDAVYNTPTNSLQSFTKDGTNQLLPVTREIRIVRSNAKGGINDANGGINNVIVDKDMGNGTLQRRVIRYVSPGEKFSKVQSDKPFATNSAACAFDKKHERLYYAPLGINQLRYIDLKAKTQAIYYFEDDSFGALTSRFDVPNQITRMVIGADGDGYALTNNANHLISFTTNKKAKITDLGALTDDPANGSFSIHSPGAFGGDMIAGDKGNLYVITAAKTVFKIDPDSKIATYLGTIQGLPRGYSTNGAIVEKGTTIIVSSASSTQGYFKFDLATLQAEAITNNGSVFNASDLANSTLLSEKKKKNDKQENLEEIAATQADKKDLQNILTANNIAVYPNPVAMGGRVKLSFRDQPKGRYTIQFIDISGKLIDSRRVNISGKYQVEEYKLPSKILGRGNYLVKVVSDLQKVVSVNTIVVQ
ncbi:MAG: T9SS type A sorting domain-containing protein [Segetibacter sp.]|nr:T9SS type A sorting domain-containing protein [Segetibacter sp.]